MAGSSRALAPPEAELGSRVRALRLGRRMSLRSLAAQIGASAGFLSQLERGQANASVGMLRRLAAGLGVSLPDLFSDAGPASHKVLRRSERPEIHASHHMSKYLLSQTPLLNMEVYSAEISPGGGAGDPYVHGEAQEMLIVTRGCLVLVLADSVYRLDQGDSAEYQTSVPHTVRNESAEPAELLWIISPPTLGRK